MVLIALWWKADSTLIKKECFKKMWYTYIMEYYSAIRRNETMLFAATRMDIEIVILSEVSQTEKDKYHDITYMCNLKNKTN